MKIRKELLGASAEVNCEIPLNRYSFFEELQDKLLPNMRRTKVVHGRLPQTI